MKIHVLMVVLGLYGVWEDVISASVGERELFIMGAVRNDILLMTSGGKIIGRIHLKEGDLASCCIEKRESVLVEEVGTREVYVAVKAPLHGRLVSVRGDEKIYILCFRARIREEDFLFKVEAAGVLDLDEWGVYKGDKLLIDAQPEECVAANFLRIDFP